MMFRWISSEQLLASVSLSGLKKAAKKYVKIPLLELPSALVESLSMQLPVVLIGRFFGSEIVGFFALAERVVRAPMTVIASSFSSVFRQAASEAYALTGDARTIFNKTLHRLAIFAIPPFIVLATTAPYLFSIVFGGKWRTSGSYAQIITPVLLLSFIATPLGTMLLIAGKQAYNLCMQIGLFVGIFLSIHIGYYAFGSVRYALCLLTIVYVTKHVFELYFSKRFCLKEGIDAVSGKRPS
jgi:O-antigen/teichoic acid export membrane protein